MLWRRSERENGITVSTRDQGKARRDRGVFMDYLQVPCTSRPRERQGHEGSALRKDAQNNALRCQADALRRVQDHRRSLSSLVSFKTPNLAAKKLFLNPTETHPTDETEKVSL